MSVEIRTLYGDGDASAFESRAEVVRESLREVLEAEAPSRFERVLSDFEAQVAGALRKVSGLGVEEAADLTRAEIARGAVEVLAAATFAASANFLRSDPVTADAFTRGLREVSG